MATSTGAKAPQSAQTISESPWSDDAWQNPANIYGAGEASVTAATFDAGDQTEVLKAYNFDFSAVPSTATITGVTCIINARYANAPASIDLCQLLDTSRAKVGTNLAATPVALTTSAANYTFGGSSNLWGNSLTVAWVQDADFGVAIGCLAGGSGNNNVDVYIDSVTLNVAYTDNKNLSAGYGSATLTGYAPIAAAPRNVKPGYGEVVLTGYAPAIVKGTVVRPGYGELTAEGFAPTVTATNHININAGKGELTVAGYEPEIDCHGNQIYVELANYAGSYIDLERVVIDFHFSGEDACDTVQIVSRGGGSFIYEEYDLWYTEDTDSYFAYEKDTCIPAPDGFYVYQTNTSVYEINDGKVTFYACPIEIESGYGELLLTGYEPVISISDNKNIHPDKGELSLEGYSPNILIPRNVTPDKGELSLEGYEPSVSLSDNKRVFPDYGELSLEGYSPTVQTPREVHPNLGELTIEGFAPTINISDNKFISADYGELNLDGYQPSIKTPRDVHVDLGELTIEGFTPVVSVTNNKNIQPFTGNISLDGYAPVVIVATNDIVVFPGFGELLVEGHIPNVTVSKNQLINTDLGQLILQAFAPAVTTSIKPKPPVQNIGRIQGGMGGIRTWEEDNDVIIEIVKFTLENTVI